MRIKSLDVGVERITQFGLDEDVHLPAEGKAAPAFLPQFRPLDAILQRPSLNERLPELLQPSGLDPGLLEPAALADTRRELRQLFLRRSAAAQGGAADALAAAADLLDSDDVLDHEVRAALALLMRG